MNLPDKHLDLGCGTRPRNPYGRSRLYGVDIRDIPPTDTFESRAANLSLDAIPYADNMFGSVSAFDFIEHIPRVLAVDSGRRTTLPFIDLMNEIWRVLAPGGRLYAVTPAFPAPEVFVDPTHVNVITKRTHFYFSGVSPWARMYGFNGDFKALRVEWVTQPDLSLTVGDEWAAEREEQRRQAEKRKHLSRRLAYGVRESIRFLRGKREWQLPENRKSHLMWEFEAVKPQTE